MRVKSGRRCGAEGWRRHPESNQGITALRAAALSLGYAAIRERMGTVNGHLAVKYLTILRLFCKHFSTTHKKPNTKYKTPPYPLSALPYSEPATRNPYPLSCIPQTHSAQIVNAMAFRHCADRPHICCRNCLVFPLPPGGRSAELPSKSAAGE